jgi:hypothetical protein
LKNAVLSKGMSAELVETRAAVDHVGCAHTEVSNEEAAATPPPQLPTQHASNFQVPDFFFFFKFVREVGLAIIHKRI